MEREIETKKEQEEEKRMEMESAMATDTNGQHSRNGNTNANVQANKCVRVCSSMCMCARRKPTEMTVFTRVPVMGEVDTSASCGGCAPLWQRKLIFVCVCVCASACANAGESFQKICVTNSGICWT